VPIERKDQQPRPVSESPVGPDLLLYDDVDDDDQAAGHFPVISTDSRPPNAQAQTHARPTHQHESKPVNVRDDVEALRKPFQARHIPALLICLTLSCFAVKIKLLLNIK
jgi:hypothetical protein